MEETLEKEALIREFIGEGNDALEKLSRFNELMMRYNAAIREVRTKFEVLNDEFSFRNSRNPIESITSRIKKPVSIAEKLRRMGCPLTLESVSENLNDIAGIRVICSFIDDIYMVAELLARQDDITVVRVKDYIQKPKENGYRSFHMIVEVPVFFSNEKNDVRVEVQLRTIAMDFWATLEHGIKYKKEIADSAAIVAELKDCAEQVYALDTRMQSLRDRIRGAK